MAWNNWVPAATAFFLETNTSKVSYFSNGNHLVFSPLAVYCLRMRGFRLVHWLACIIIFSVICFRKVYCHFGMYFTAWTKAVNRHEESSPVQIDKVHRLYVREQSTFSKVL